MNEPIDSSLTAIAGGEGLTPVGPWSVHPTYSPANDAPSRAVVPAGRSGLDACHAGRSGLDAGCRSGRLHAGRLPGTTDDRQDGMGGTGTQPGDRLVSAHRADSHIDRGALDRRRPGRPTGPALADSRCRSPAGRLRRHCRRGLCHRPPERVRIGIRRAPSLRHSPDCVSTGPRLRPALPCSPPDSDRTTETSSLGCRCRRWGRPACRRGSPTVADDATADGASVAALSDTTDATRGAEGMAAGPPEGDPRAMGGDGQPLTGRAARRLRRGAPRRHGRHRLRWPGRDHLGHRGWRPDLGDPGWREPVHRHRTPRPSICDQASIEACRPVPR